MLHVNKNDVARERKMMLHVNKKMMLHVNKNDVAREQKMMLHVNKK